MTKQIISTNSLLILIQHSQRAREASYSIYQANEIENSRSNSSLAAELNHEPPKHSGIELSVGRERSRYNFSFKSFFNLSYIEMAESLTFRYFDCDCNGADEIEDAKDLLTDLLGLLCRKKRLKLSATSCSSGRAS